MNYSVSPSYVVRRSGAPYRAPHPVERARTMTRPYSVSWMSTSGEMGFDTVVAPAIPIIENACGSLVRGSLVATSSGPVAVEDLTPGMGIVTREHGVQPLRWIGSYEITPRAAQMDKRIKLFRVTSDAFGLAKPSHDLVMAPGGHILTTLAACQSMFGVPQAYAPIRAYEDGMSVIAVTPISPVSVFNICLDKQSTITANGVEVETFHPGSHSDAMLDDEMTMSLLRLFPFHRGLEGFGPQITERLSVSEAQDLRSAA